MSKRQKLLNTHPSLLITRHLVRTWLPRRKPEAHKGNFGHVLVVAGSRGMTGAALLCAASALRAGAGLVTLATPKSQQPIAAAGGPWEMMTLPLEETPAGAADPRALSRILNFMEARRVTALALGPGLSTDPRTVRLVKALLSSSPAPAVVDADALNALARGGWPGARRSPWVLTPHPGELARLAKKTPREVQSRRAESARRLSARRGVVCVLKGRGTVVTDGRRTWVNATGNPAMATGGMGDVLAGLIAGLAGQTAGDGTEEKLFRAAVAGVYIHGLAGDLAAKSLGPAGLLAGDVLAFLPRAFKKVYR